jgi:hypothetical protein
MTPNPYRPVKRLPPDAWNRRRKTQSFTPSGGENVGIGVSIFLIAVGAILTWAVNASVSGLELDTIGVILMVVGALGLVLSMISWSSWGGFGGARRTTYVDYGPRY